MEGVDVYFLAKQMETSVKMIEDYYGRVTPSTSTDQILQGMPGWEPVASPVERPPEVGRGDVSSAQISIDGRRPAPTQVAAKRVERQGSLRSHLAPRALPNVRAWFTGPGSSGAPASPPRARSQGWHHPAFTTRTSRPACDLSSLRQEPRRQGDTLGALNPQTNGPRLSGAQRTR